MWRADLLRAGGAAAVVHFWLVNIRKKALVAVFIWRWRQRSWSEQWVVILVSLFITLTHDAIFQLSLTARRENQLNFNAELDKGSF